MKTSLFFVIGLIVLSSLQLAALAGKNSELLNKHKFNSGRRLRIPRDNMLVADISVEEMVSNLRRDGTSVTFTFPIDASLETVWEVIGDWNNMSWIDTVERMERTEDKFGRSARRVIPKTGGQIDEFNAELDQEQHIMSYYVFKTTALPLQAYMGTARLAPGPGDTTQFTYVGVFIPNEGVDASLIAEGLKKKFGTTTVAHIQNMFARHSVSNILLKLGGLEDILHSLRSDGTSAHFTFPIDCSVEDMWNVVSDWDNISWVNAAIGFERLPNKYGKPARRVLTKTMPTDELLVEVNAEERSLIYYVFATGMPVTGYMGHIQLSEGENGNTVFDYTATFLPKEGVEASKFAEALSNGFRTVNIPFLQKRFGTSEPADNALLKLGGLEDILHSLRSDGTSAHFTFPIDCPVEDMWNVVSDWNNISWVRVAVGVESLPNEYGKPVRRVLTKTVPIDELLVEVNAEERSLTYYVLATDMPVTGYMGYIQLSEGENGNTVFDYTATFKTKEGVDSSKFAEALSNGFRTVNIPFLQERFGRNEV